jgi:hypothetical protein
MAVFIWLPAILFGTVVIIVAAVSIAVEVSLRRKAHRRAQRQAARARGFRPVVIQGGRPENRLAG